MTPRAGGAASPEVRPDAPDGGADPEGSDDRAAEDRDAPEDRDDAGDAPPDAERPDEVGTPDPSGRSGGDQPWSWHALRVSGLFLAVLVPIHFVVTIIGGDVGDTDAGTMYQRFRNDRWRGLEWVTIGLALVHSVLAIRAAIARSDLAPVAQRRLDIVTTAAGVALAAVAAWFLITYR